MADPTEPAIWIDLALQDAIMRHEFSALERRVLDAIMRYTYAAGKAKANITAEDVRLMVEGVKRVRTDRVEQVLVKLTEQHVLTYQDWNGGPLRGIQRDSKQWLEGKVDKLSSPINRIDINIYNYSRSGVDKMSTTEPSTPRTLLDYSQKQSGFEHATTAWRIEHSWAIKLYKKVLGLTNDPLQAKQLICDYIDENEWMRQNVQRQFTYMYTRFDQWMAQIPRKPREYAEAEESTGRRYRYNVRNKNWEAVMPSPEGGMK